MKSIVKKFLSTLSMVATSISVSDKSGLIVIKCQPDASVIAHIKTLMISSPDSLVCTADNKVFKAVAYDVGDEYSDGTKVKFAYCHLREVKPTTPMSDKVFDASFDLALGK